MHLNDSGELFKYTCAHGCKLKTKRLDLAMQHNCQVRDLRTLVGLCICSALAHPLPLSLTPMLCLHRRECLAVGRQQGRPKKVAMVVGL